jgi:hypothetical protein
MESILERKREADFGSEGENRSEPQTVEEDLQEKDEPLDVVEEESLESFPASDSPASNSFTGAEDIDQDEK